MKHTPVETSIGTFNGRDAIYLDDIVQSYSKRTISFSGEINSSLASAYAGDFKWLPYTIEFQGVDSVFMVELDCYDHELSMTSSFDEVDKPRLKSRDPKCRHFVFATYDHIFEVMATGYNLSLRKDGLAEKNASG